MKYGEHRKYRKTYHIVFAVFCFCMLFTLLGISDLSPAVAAEQEKIVKTDHVIEVLERDEKFFATLPYAENEEALTAPIDNIMTLADFQSDANVWKKKGSLAVAKPGYSDRCFDIYGVDNDSFYKTTFTNAGYVIASMVNGKQVKWMSAPKTNVSMGGSLVGQFDYDIVYNGRYAKITYTVKNTGSVVQSFQIGSSADVMIDQNDKAPVIGTPMGLKMEDGTGKTFHLVVPDADTTWYGFFSQAYSNIFNNLTDKSTPYTGDSGMAWSWNGSVAPGSTWTRSALIGIGELPAAPAAPVVTIALDGNRNYVKPNETITVSGTATAGTTVHMMAGGVEYEALVGSNGRFSKQITIPSDAKDSIDIICWAVSSEGGISETVTKKLTVANEPQLFLTDSTATVTEGDSLNEAWYQKFIKTSVGTVSHTTVSTNTPGTYNVIYTAQVTGFLDVTKTLKVAVLAHPLEIAVPTATGSGNTSKYNLTARLSYPGAAAITETGFVWGIMQNPTTSMCNGKKATTSVVKTKGSSISVMTDDIADGVTYYCRAYVVAGRVTYYSAQTSFALNAKSYGTFNVSGSGNVFTITRTGGTDGKQTVYYRTKNGSAVAGTHYTGKGDIVSFAPGETTQTVTVTEKALGANAAYNQNAATQYSNAGREYFFEIYRVDGGGVLGENTEAKRTMASSKKIDRSIYNRVKSNTGIVTTSSPQYIQDRTGNQGAEPDTVNFTDVNRDNVANWHRDIGVEGIYGSDTKAYLAATQNTYWLYRFTLSGKEKEQGYEDVWFGSKQPPTGDHSLGGKETLPNLDGQIWAGIFEIDGSGKMTETTMKVLDNSGSLSPTKSGWKGTNVTYENNHYGRLNIDASAWVCFSAHGDDEDQWYVTAYDEHSVVQDTKEPQLIGVGSTESTSKYKAGDTFYISLIFDEIVDSQNSTNIRNVSVNTSWGTASYAGGVDTNVLYFKGTVSDSASGVLTLNSIANPGSIKDMCSAAGTETATGTGDAGGSSDNTTPTVTVGNIANTNGTLTATVSATNHHTLKYAWTQNSAMPATGWLGMTSGSKAITRQTSGTWYLHVLATNTTNGKTAYGVKSYTFSASAVTLPELALTADNTNWAQKRTIQVTKSPGDAKVTYTGPGVTNATAVGSSISVTQNGVYTFTLTSGSDTVVKQVTVSKIDTSAPTAVITEPGSEYLTQSENVTFTIGASDIGGSGVGSVTGKWYKDGSSSGTAAAFTNNGDGTYTVKSGQTSGASGTWKLTVTVTDNAGNTVTASSQTYTVNLKMPTVTVTKGAADSNGSVNYTYSVNANGQTIQSIELPDGSFTTDTSGSFKLTSAGTYYVTVTDTAGHVVQSDAMTVTSAVDGEPPVIRLSPSTEDWVNAGTGVIVTVSVYDNVAPVSASREKQGESGGTTVSLSQDTAAGVGNQAKVGSFKVTENGTYTVTARDAKGNIATELIEITNIDSTAPTVAVVVDNDDWSSISHTITITAEDAGDKASGVRNIKYAVVSTPSDTATNLTTLPDTGSGSVTVNTNGIQYLYCVVEDNAGNKSICYSGAIKVDTIRPTVTVTGGTAGASSLDLSVSADFGSSGKKSFVVKKGSDGVEAELTEDTYCVSDSGIYYFTATSNAGKSLTKEVTVCDIRFHSNGGSSVSTQYAVSGGQVTEPTAPTRTGYTFAGWYSDSALITPYDFTASVEADQTLYAKWKDNIEPVIGTLKYSYQPNNIRNWLIGRDSLVITVPVTEEGSGADQITYTMIPEDGTAGAKTSAIVNGEAKITVSADFKGAIVVTCTDKDGNKSAGVTVGTDLDGNAEGILIEDHAPQITYKPENADMLTTGEYETASDVTVTVMDNKDNVLSAGIASVSYQIGNGSVKTVDHDYTTGMIANDSFTIPASEIPAGETVITVTAKDHAGNTITKTQTIKIHSHSGTLVPEQAPTCTEAGTEQYYTCACGKWFEDRNCTREITDHAKVTEIALGHSFEGRDYVYNGTQHWRTCSRCGVSEQKEEHDFDDATDKCTVCGYEKTAENPPETETGFVSTDVAKGENAPDTQFATGTKELADMLLTEAEKGQVENGTDIKFVLDVKDASTTVSSEDKGTIQAALGDFAVGQYLDIGLFKIIGENRSLISETAGKITIVIDVPAHLKNTDEKTSREFAVIRVHAGKADVLNDLDNSADTITIATDRFSAYAIVYKDTTGQANTGTTPEPPKEDKPEPPKEDKPEPPKEDKPEPPKEDKPQEPGEHKPQVKQPSEKEKRMIELNSGLKAVQTGKSLSVSWGRVFGADGYHIYVQYCGKKFTARSLHVVKSGKTRKLAVKKINGKKINTTKDYKVYVVAYKMVGKKKNSLAKSITAHIAGKDSRKYTNVKTVKVKKTSYTLKKGESVKIQPKAVLYNKRKKQLSGKHTKQFRYQSSNPNVATVSSVGKIQAKDTGECIVYVYARNGCKRKIKVKVK